MCCRRTVSCKWLGKGFLWQNFQGPKEICPSFLPAAHPWRGSVGRGPWGLGSPSLEPLQGHLHPCSCCLLCMECPYPIPSLPAQPDWCLSPEVPLHPHGTQAGSGPCLCCPVPSHPLLPWASPLTSPDPRLGDPGALHLCVPRASHGLLWIVEHPMNVDRIKE